MCNQTMQKPVPADLRDYPSSYQETKIGKTLYCVTSVYLGEIELGKALEDLTVRRILKSENMLPQYQNR